jgi:hypothetical protein
LIIALMLIVCLHNSVAIAAALDCATWVNAWHKNGPKALQNLFFVHKLAVIQGMNKDVNGDAVEFDAGALKQLSFSDAVDPGNARLILQLNDPPKPAKGIDSQTSQLQYLFKLLDVDGVVVTSIEGEWHLFSRSRAKTIDDVVLASPLAGTETLTAAKLAPWLRQAQGFDAIVIATEGDRLLLVGDVQQLKAKPQGVILANSAGSAILPRKAISGVAIIEIEEVVGKFATARRLIERNAASNAPIQVGAKIMFSKNP